jgi:AcrR family transcriptional regulator
MDEREEDIGGASGRVRTIRSHDSEYMESSLRMSSAAPSDRPLRADARANRALVLDAADAVFGEGGDSASTEEVARRAGVGIATVFRHFPTKATLLEAVLVRRFERLREQGDDLAQREEPGPAFFDFVTLMVADAATKIAVAEALLAMGAHPSPGALEAAAALRQTVGGLLERAQRAGAVRADVELPEVYALLVGACRAAAHGKLDEDLQTRMLAIVFAGLAPQLYQHRTFS